MIESIKNNISRFFISNKLKHNELSEQDFSQALKRSGSFFVLMPEDEKDFRSSFIVLEHLDHLNKAVKILARDYRISLMPAKFRNRSIEFGVNDLNRLNLPNHKLIGKLSEMKFDGVIDLNRKDELFYSYAANIVNAKIRIGYSKKNSDKYYNFQIANNYVESEVSYNNFLNCLKMF